MLQVFQMLESGVGDAGAVDVEVFKLSESGNGSQSFVRDGRAFQMEGVEVLERCERREGATASFTAKSTAKTAQMNQSAARKAAR